MKDALITLSIVVPCLNEEEMLPLAKKAFLSLLSELISSGKVSSNSHICFVDDGSSDQTWALIQKYQSESKQVRGIKLSRNFGHQNALLAGLFSSSSDVVITVDVDLQDDIQAIHEMIDRFYKGDEVVFGVRKQRQTDRLLKRFTAQGFYKLMRFFGCHFVYNHADFRLLSRRAVDALKEFHEVNLFLRGMVPLLGFQSSSVFYDRAKRVAGCSKYSIRKMMQFAFEGITSFSIFPLKLISMIGLIVFVFSLFVGGWAFASWLHGKGVAGWVSTITIVSFMGGVQMLSLGIIGEYIGKIYGETKQRPRFIIDENIGFDSHPSLAALKQDMEPIT